MLLHGQKMSLRLMMELHHPATGTGTSGFYGSAFRVAVRSKGRPAGKGRDSGKKVSGKGAVIKDLQGPLDVHPVKKEGGSLWRIPSNMEPAKGARCAKQSEEAADTASERKVAIKTSGVRRLQRKMQYLLHASRLYCRGRSNCESAIHRWPTRCISAPEP